MKWRSGYDEKENEKIGRECATVNDGPVVTQQSFALDADINVLVRRFGVEKLSQVTIDPSKYGDFSDAPDLRQALEIMRDAEEQFMRLDPKLRSRFRNSPAELWDFVQDPENVEEGIRLGIFEKPRPTAPEAVPGESPAAGGEPPKGADNA